MKDGEQKKAAYKRAAAELRIIHAELTAWLNRAKAHVHRNMREVAPGVWIHNDFKDFGEALAFLRKMLP